MSQDPFADAFVHMKNSDYVAKNSCVIAPATKMVEKVLAILKNEKYIIDFAKQNEKNKEAFVIKLNGNITNCGAIKPRLAFDNMSYEKFEKKYLPGKNVGLLIVSTSQGVMTHIDAKRRNIGGRLLAYIY